MEAPNDQPFPGRLFLYYFDSDRDGLFRRMSRSERTSL